MDGESRVVRRTRESHDRRLSTPQLAVLAVYWLGVTAMWIGLGQILAGRLEFEQLVTPGTEGVSLLQMIAVGTIVAVLVQPVVGTLSDHTATRWGRRRPYIAAGSLLDVVFLAAIATSHTVLAIAAFFLLLQLSSNIAQGPYQGYVPDLVPHEQVGTASGLIGLMLILGSVLGYVIGALAIATGQFGVATLALGLLELATVVILMGTTTEPRGAARPRAGRSWFAIARGAWSGGVLGERDFLWFVGSRGAILIGSEVLVSLAPFYLARTFHLDRSSTGIVLLILVGTVAAATAGSVLPAARLSDRLGRRPLIWLACGTGAVGLVICALAPVVPIAFVGAACFGVAGGTFLAVDWALLAELVPRDRAGQFMGISNVATASAGMLAVAFGGTIMDLVGGPGRTEAGPRAALLFGVACYGLGALLLGRVREPRRSTASVD